MLNSARKVLSLLKGERNISDYSAVQKFVTKIIINKKLFYKPIPSEGVYLDIGPGTYMSREFYNIDCIWRPGIHMCTDLKNGLPLPKDSVLGVYTEHCIEHLDFEVTFRLFKDLYNAMKRGAVLRIIVPDGELHARKYVESLDIGKDVTPYRGGRIKCGISTPILSLNSVMRDHGHKFLYDFMTLKEMLLRAGFQNVKRCRYREGRDPKLLRDVEDRQFESLYLEAYK